MIPHSVERVVVGADDPYQRWERRKKQLGLGLGREELELFKKTNRDRDCD